MPNKTWQAGEKLTANDINTYLSNQSVMTFADSAARSAAITSPTIGMVSYLTGTGALEIYTDKTNPPSWRPPWSAAWGLVYNANVTDLAINTGFQWIVPNTLPVNIPGRLYKVEFDGSIQVTGTTASSFYLQFQNQFTRELQTLYSQNLNWWTIFNLHDWYRGRADNLLGVIAKADQTASTTWMFVRVYDVGPASA